MLKSAIIIIDMQNEFCLEVSSNEKPKLKNELIPVVNKINDTVLKFRKNGDRVIWLNWGITAELDDMSSSQLKVFGNFEYSESMNLKKKLNKNCKVLEKGSWSASIVEDLNNFDEDLYITKERMSGFWFTDLDKILKELNVEKLYFTGVNTDQCVMTTLQDAHFIGYETYLIKDCTTTSSPQYCFDATIYNVQNCFGSVVESKDIK